MEYLPPCSSACCLCSTTAFGSPVVQGCSSIAAAFQGTMCWKQWNSRQDECCRKVVILGDKSRSAAQTVALRQVSGGLSLILWEVEKTKVHLGEWSLFAEWLSKRQHERVINFCSLPLAVQTSQSLVFPDRKVRNMFAFPSALEVMT